MNHLLRSVAPVTERAWEMLDQEAREHLVPALGARKLVDFAGPFGFDYSATNLGRVTNLASAPCDGVEAKQRRVLPLVELRSDFKVSRDELIDFERGAVDTDLDDLDEAVRRVALAENSAVFNGFEAAGIVGIAQATRHSPIPLGKEPGSFPRAGREGGRADPAGGHRRPLRPGARARRVHARRRDDRARRLSGVRAPRAHPRRPDRVDAGLDGAVVVSLRGGDFLFESVRISRSASTGSMTGTCTCTSKRPSASVSRPRRLRSRCPERGVGPERLTTREAREPGAPRSEARALVRRLSREATVGFEPA